jgi:hypothetical protein
MTKRIRLTDKEIVDIINGYTVDLTPMIELAKRYGITRQGIYKVLKRAGIDIAGSGKLLVSCSCCGKEFEKHRCQVRLRLHVFCSPECYKAWLQHGNGNPLIMHRQSSRTARAIVSEHFALRPGNIVHHEDRNQYNNMLYNLRVFVNQGDHVRYHRGANVPVLWDGRDIGQKING